MDAPETPNLRERLEEGFCHYRVPDERTEEFVALQRRAEAIYRGTALDWALSRTQQDPEVWIESGPHFREEADLERAAEGFEAEPDLLASLIEFDEDLGEGIFQFTGINWEPVLAIGDGRHPGTHELPAIEPAQMTEAMRDAHALARAMAPRLDNVLPSPFAARAANETIVLTNAGVVYTELFSLVDVELEMAIHAMLNNIQDEVSEELTEPWPKGPSQGTALPEPGVDIGDDAIRWWYGEKDAPALELEPIPLAELKKADS